MPVYGAGRKGTPDTEYRVTLRCGGDICSEFSVRTDYEFVTLNVRRFGAKGDGIHDDIQTCIDRTVSIVISQ